ncbi:MAG TPA: hypothetical protein DCP10_05385 [Bacteroidales bacterium]|nr:hypothetical protein [Bacteroidales bacterium]
MEEIKLKKIAKISSGMVLKRFIKSMKSSAVPTTKNTEKSRDDYYHITIKSVEDNKIHKNLFEQVSMERTVDDKYLLKKGDIVMKLTPPYSTAVIDFECENLVAPSNFAIIRVKDEFDSEYVSFVLNSKNIRKQLNRLVEGTTLAVIKINHLKELDIRCRDKKEQIKYAELASLLSKRLTLRTRILEIEKELTEDLLSGI